MAWRSTGANNRDLFNQLRGTNFQTFSSALHYWTLSEHGVIKSDSVYNALANTDRKFYTQTAYPYVDSPQSIGYGATISAPHMVSSLFVLNTSSPTNSDCFVACIRT